MSTLKSIGAFLALALAVVGLIGGIGVCIWSRQWVPAVAILVLAALAVPTCIKLVNILK